MREEHEASITGALQVLWAVRQHCCLCTMQWGLGLQVGVAGGSLLRAGMCFSCWLAALVLTVTWLS